MKELKKIFKTTWDVLLILLMGISIFVGIQTIGLKWTGTALMGSITVTALAYGLWGVFTQIKSGTMSFKIKGQEFIEIIYASIFKNKFWKFFGLHFIGWSFRNEGIKKFNVDIAKFNKDLNEKNPESWVINQGEKREVNHLRKKITRFIRVQVKLADGMDIYIGVAFVLSVVNFLDFKKRLKLGGKEFIFIFNASFSDPQNFLTGHVRDKAAEEKTYKDLVRDAGTLLNSLKRHYYDYKEYDDDGTKLQVPLITENEETKRKKVYAQFEEIREELINLLFLLKDINKNGIKKIIVGLEEELKEFQEKLETLKNLSKEEVISEDLLYYKKNELRKYILNLRLVLKENERNTTKEDFGLVLKSFGFKFENIEKKFQDPLLQEELKDFGFLLEKIEIVAHHPVDPKVLEAAQKKQIAEMELEAILIEVKGKKKLAQVELEAIAEKAADLFENVDEKERAKYVFSYLERIGLPNGLQTLIMDVIKNK